jgi:hypothetical protein
MVVVSSPRLFGAARRAERESRRAQLNIVALPIVCSDCLMKNRHMTTLSALAVLHLWLALLLARSSLAALRFARRGRFLRRLAHHMLQMRQQLAAGCAVGCRAGQGSPKGSLTRRFISS